MAHFTQDSSAIIRRYETHHHKMMTLVVTRQNQKFTPTSDLSLVDLELVNATVELVGEPGIGGVGIVGGGYDGQNTSNEEKFAMYNNSLNLIHAVNNEGQTSKVLNNTQPNKIVMRPDIHHGWCDVTISGMTQNRHFLQDDSVNNNDVSLLVPTDLGLLVNRTKTTVNPQMLENVKMEQTLTVTTRFVGTGDIPKRTARFTEDFADTAPATYRNADGTVKYYDAAEGQSSTAACHIPANCINMMILQFKVSPRSTV